LVDATPYDGLVTLGYETGSFDGYALTVTVTDGFVTVQAGAGALDPKINFIEVAAVGIDTDPATTTRVQAAAEQATHDTAKTKAKMPPVMKRNIWGRYVDELVSHTLKKVRKSPARYYAHVNHLYSVSALTDSAGVVVERYAYDAYGKQTITAGVGGAVRTKSAVGFDRSFTGYVADNESGYLFAHSRMYSPGLGRFVNRDPAAYPDGFNAYAAYFVPRGLDPSGMDWGWDDFWGHYTNGVQLVHKPM
jgi:RHS repeat-associated protein